MVTTKPKLLITRPEPQAQQLASTLHNAGYSSYCQALFCYQANQTTEELNALLNNTRQPTLIFVSKAAVQFANKLLPIAKWPSRTIIAVGSATRDALLALDVSQVIMPPRHDSEGVLSLSELNNIKGKDVIIIRGDGGRELIAEQLKDKSAYVHYFESYQKHWLSLDASIAETWRNHEISAIIITSNALLESVVQLINNNDNYWQNTCLWLVASKRIASNANKLGLRNVVCTDGASDQAILNALVQLELNK